MKPAEYRAPFIVRCDTPYQVDDQASKGTHSATGTLQVGRVVWSPTEPENFHGELISCYAEGVGIVSVHSGDLRRVR